MQHKELIFVAITLIVLGLVGFVLVVFQAPAPLNSIYPVENPIARPPMNGVTICRVTGCSGHVCSHEEVITTCEWMPEYACYRDAKCEIQPTGECGWTMNDALRQCLLDANQALL